MVPSPRAAALFFKAVLSRTIPYSFRASVLPPIALWMSDSASESSMLNALPKSYASEVVISERFSAAAAVMPNSLYMALLETMKLWTSAVLRCTASA